MALEKKITDHSNLSLNHQLYEYDNFCAALSKNATVGQINSSVSIHATLQKNSPIEFIQFSLLSISNTDNEKNTKYA